MDGATAAGVWNKKPASQYCDPSSHFGNGDLIYVFKHRVRANDVPVRSGFARQFYTTYRMGV
jgi:hypothetical protein